MRLFGSWQAINKLGWTGVYKVSRDRPPGETHWFTFFPWVFRYVVKESGFLDLGVGLPGERVVVDERKSRRVRLPLLQALERVNALSDGVINLLCR